MRGPPMDSVSFTGQAFTQRLHAMHSELCTCATDSTGMFTGQALSQAMQCVQVASFLFTRNQPSLLMRPRKPPMGQRYLQKNLSYRSEPTRLTTRMIRPIEELRDQLDRQDVVPGRPRDHTV